MFSNFRDYVPEYQTTQNYMDGMTALLNNNLEEAVKILQQEPEFSPCYSLAIGNSALALLRLEKFEEAEKWGIKTLEELNKDKYFCPHVPSGIQFFRNLGESIMKQGRYIESIRFLNQTIGLATNFIEKLTKFGNQEDLIKQLELEKAHAFNSWGVGLINIGNWEASIDCLNSAREIYKKYKPFTTNTYIDALINISYSYRSLKKDIEAENALKEAKDIAIETNYIEQLHRINIGLIQLGSELISINNYSRLIEEAATHSIKEKHFSTAYLRYSIGASLVENDNNIKQSKFFISKAKELEIYLDKFDLNIAKLRKIEAMVLAMENHSTEEIVETLIDGANRWFEIIKNLKLLEDFHIYSHEIHNHFRLLTFHLIKLNRINEAIISFEAGRALSYSIEVDKNLFFKRLNNKEFSKDGRNIDISYLKEVQKKLQEHEVCIIFSILPPNLVSFIIGKNSVFYEEVDITDKKENVLKFIEEISMTPIRLGEKVEERSIPKKITDLSQKVLEKIVSKKIVRIIPHSVLHSIPWRGVFNYLGMDLLSLPYSINFSLYLFDKGNEYYYKKEHKISSFSNGFSGSINLNTLAKAFSNNFSNNIYTYLNCSPEVFKNSFINNNDIIFICCHGRSRGKNLHGVNLTLEFNNKEHYVFNDLPEKIKSQVVILSACESGVYEVDHGDYPIGAAPLLIKLGVKHCIVSRYPIPTLFANNFFSTLASNLASGIIINEAFILSLDYMKNNNSDLWSELSCVELISYG
ncbi:MAG: CHAT domain-containing protein [Candidatus Sericytochromatia bacterium]